MAGLTGDRSRDRSVAILGFHKIGEPSFGGARTWFYIPEETFVGFLEILRNDGWQVIDLAAFLTGLELPETLPDRAALLTFDDGYRSVLEVALPWLLRFGHPGVLFVPTDYVGGVNAFDEGVEPEEPICDWEDLRELERAGVSVQSHGASHRRLSELLRAEQERELIHSKTILEENLGTPAEVIAFPYGDSGHEGHRVSAVLRRAGYRAACSYGGGPIPLPAPDRYRLARLAMGPDTDLRAALESTE